MTPAIDQRDDLAFRRERNAARQRAQRPGPEPIWEETAIAWLSDAARYFETRPTHGEDSAFWANMANAEACRRIASLIDRVRTVKGEG